MRISKSTKADIKASIDSDIARYKKSLTQKASKSGLYENFGANEIRKLRGKYSVYPDDVTDYRTAEHNRNSLDSFEDWCMNYVGACSNVSINDQALQHIKAAIDILGKSGNRDDVTKDSIANLATVMFDIKANTVVNASSEDGKTIKDVIPEDKWASIELVDGEGEGGGISYAGETLDNFLAECEMNGSESFSELKKAFKECGVAFKDKSLGV